jgi:hypothetical protein
MTLSASVGGLNAARAHRFGQTESRIQGICLKAGGMSAAEERVRRRLRESHGKGGYRRDTILEQRSQPRLWAEVAPRSEQGPRADGRDRTLERCSWACFLEIHFRRARGAPNISDKRTDPRIRISDVHAEERAFWLPKDARWSHLRASARKESFERIVDDTPGFKSGGQMITSCDRDGLNYCRTLLTEREHPTEFFLSNLASA